MQTRIVLELSEDPKKGTTWKNTKQTLKKSGGAYISEPPENPPYIITAVMPDEETAQKTVRLLRAMKGVTNADIDQMRTIF